MNKLEEQLLELFFAARQAQKALCEIMSATNSNLQDSDVYTELENICDKIIDSFCVRCSGSYQGPKEVETCWACKYEPRIKL